MKVHVSTKCQLIKSTNLFFTRHWSEEISAPIWDFSWRFQGAIPNYLLGGVYALLRGEEVVYLGLGISKGGGIYKDRGISRSLQSHVYKRDDTPTGYTLKPHWRDKGITTVATLGFDQDRSYLAPALENFLINSLRPSSNTMNK